MLDVFSRAVQEADAQTTYVSSDRLLALRQFATSASDRLAAVNLLRQNASDLVATAIAAMMAENPDLIQRGGNCYPARRLASCVRDGEFILRYVTYALLAGDESILKERCLDGLKETYQSLGVPIFSAIRAIDEMQVAAVNLLNAHFADGDADTCKTLCAEVARYFQMSAAALR